MIKCECICGHQSTLALHEARYKISLFQKIMYTVSTGELEDVDECFWGLIIVDGGQIGRLGEGFRRFLETGLIMDCACIKP